MRYTVRPISDPTVFGGPRFESLFTVTWSQTMELLERELGALAAREVVLEVDVTESAIRMDGQLRADAKASSPRVRLAFESKHGNLTYASDRFIRGSASRWIKGEAVRKMQDDWQHNIYAIAQCLEALRKVDRYGVTKRGEQYTGWKAIGSGPANAMPAGMSEREAESILGFWAGEDAWLTADNPKILRRARAAAHPDRNDGDQTAWDQVELAAKVLQVIS